MPKQAKDVFDAHFFEHVVRDSRESAQIIVSLVCKLLEPASVLDVGCAMGTWLDEWGKAGVSDVLGIDGDYIDRTGLLIPAEKFTPLDLEQPFSLGRTFDLVQALEVAAHLDEAHADAFVESLTKHGETILFSSAIPGQGGDHHVNEQWPSYWAEKFARAGYTLYDIIRPQIWADRRIMWWYRQDILLFARGRTFDTGAGPLDVVHPDFWENRRQVMRSVPNALATALRSKRRNV
jgi:SAM-dependent methyltransferase